MSAEAALPKLTFARVAASANSSAIPSITKTSAAPAQAPTSAPQPKESQKAVKDNDIAATDVDKFTPRQTKSSLVPGLIFGGIEDDDQEYPPHLPQHNLHGNGTIPVSEENVIRIPSSAFRPVLGMDEKSTTSATTFPLDEKESLRPDDSASVNAQEDDDGHGSTQPPSQIGSDPDARAFSEQLREISGMGQHGRQQAPNPRLMASDHPGPGMLYSPLPIAAPNNFAGVSTSLARDPSNISFPPDEKLLEALSSVRDRVWVLKLEQDITDFVKDPSAQSFDLPQCNSFYRMLAHKMADYYLLGHTMDGPTATVRLWKTPNCRIPPRLSDVTNPSTAASTPPPPMPQMKILRRNEGGTRPSSREGVNDADSESDLGRSKFPATREEREARYEAARLRILGSAKPTGDAPLAPPKDGDGSNSNSIVGKRKLRKQRSDSDDGFEARSAYSMYPQGPVSQQSQPEYNNYAQPENLPPYGQYSPYGIQTQYGQGYQMPQPQSQQWPNAGYAQGNMWNPNSYGQYDMAGHMQSMSFAPNGMTGLPVQMGQGMIGHSPNFPPPGHTGYGNTYPQTQVYPQQYPGQYPQQPYQSSQAFSYATQPAQFPGGKRYNSNPTHLNRPFFNPTSQTFVPGNGNQAPYGRPPYSNPISPAISHASAGSFPQPQAQVPPQQSQAPQSQHLVQPNPRSLTHPLPQPVFAQQISAGPQQGKPPSMAKLPPPGNGLPAKPPPVVNDRVAKN